MFIRLSRRSRRLLIGCLILGGCGTNRSAGVTSAAINASPRIGDFVLYAERALSLGRSDRVNGADVGVRSVATASFGTQLKVGSHAHVGSTHSVLAPSVSLANHSSVGDVQTNALQNIGGHFGSQTPFPASMMPLLPLAPTLGGPGADVTVACLDREDHYDDEDEEQRCRCKAVDLAPGSYGALNVAGTLRLSAGSYSFTSVTLDDHACLVTKTGPTNVKVTDTLTTGESVTIRPRRDLTAGQLSIFVLGSDTTVSVAASVGEESSIKAVLAAPHGTLALDDGVHARGAFAGFDIILARNVHVDFQDGFPNNAPGQHGQQQLSGYVVPPLSNAPLVGSVSQSTMLNIAVGLPVQNPQGLQALVQQVSDPTNPSYRQYLSVDQFTTTFGPTQADHQSIVGWAQARGLAVTTFPNRLLVDVTGTAAQIESALFININQYARPDGSLFFAPDRDPSLDSPVTVLRISGLDDFVKPTPRAGSGTGGAYLGKDFRNAFASCTSVTGSGQSVGLVEFDGYTPGDITQYEILAGLPNVPLQNVLLDGVSNTPKSTGGNQEVSLDIEMAISMAPGLSNVVVYEGNLINDILNAMATANPRSNQLSTSWGYAPDANTQQIVNEFAVQGQTYFDASGDTGAFTSDPGDDRDVQNITLVGGTVLTMNGNGVSYSSETTWSGSSGGILTNDFIPGYQVGIDMTANKGSTLFRNAPDVALVATNVEIVFTNVSANGTGTPGQITTVLGTSASAPLWAGFMALVNQQGAGIGVAPVGFFNPVLYAIGQNPALYAQTFNDIKDNSGNNGFNAVAGYDLTTGWGSPQCGLITPLGSQNPLFQYKEIEFLISTGGDNLRGDSEAQAALFLPGAITPFQTIELKAQSDPEWANGSVHDLVFVLSQPVPPTGLQKIVVTLIEHNGFIETDDNWNIESFDARLINPGSPELCVAHSIGDPTVRLTGSAGSAPFPMGIGCPTPQSAPPGTIDFIISTGGDNLRDDSEAQASVFFQGNATPQILELKASGDPEFANNTVHDKQFSLSSTAPIDHIVVTLIEHDGFIETDDNWNIEGLNIMTFGVGGLESCVVDRNGDPLVRLTGSAGSMTFQPGDGCH